MLPKLKLPPSPVEPLRKIIRQGKEQIEKAEGDIRSVTEELHTLGGSGPQAGLTAPKTLKETPPSQNEISTPQASVSKGTACLPCVPSNTIIFTNPGAKTIDQISIGDKVLDATGDYSVITETMQRPYQGEVISIVVPYQNEPITLTPEHPVLAIKANNCRRLHTTLCFPGKDNPHCKECKLRRDYKPEFIPASELSATTKRGRGGKCILLMPRLKNTTNINQVETASIAAIGYEELSDGTIKPRKENAHNRGRSAIPIKKSLKVDTDFMKLIGFYLAEGSVNFQRRGAILRFDFGKHEPPYAQEVVTLLRKIFGVEAKIIQNTPSTLRVQTLSSILGYFFANLLGQNSLNKKIPPWILTLPTKKQASLIGGYWRGDGYSRREKKVRNSMSFQATTISPQLAFSLRLILHRLGFIHNLSKRKLGTTVIEGRKVHSQDYRYVLSVGGPSAIKLGKMMGFHTCPWRFLQSHLAGMDDNYIYLPIKSIEKHPYSGLVHNLTTKPNNTYLANGIIVHNCSRDHLSVTSSALGEAVRFAREKGVKDPEALRRIRIALDELNIMERIDLAPDETAKLKGAEKELAGWTLKQSRDLRHAITAIKDVETMEQVAARASQVTEEFMGRLWAIPEEECETCEEVRESIRQFIERRKRERGE